MNTRDNFILKEHLSVLVHALQTLITAPPETLDEFVRRYPTAHGVYVITDSLDAEIIYVGRSISARDGLGQRIYDHVNNCESSDLNQKLGGNRELAKKHCIRTTVIDDPTLRRLVEHYAIAALKPRLNR